VSRPSNAAADIDPIARALIRRKVPRLVGRFGFTRSDADDLAQELALRAHVAGLRFDAGRSGGFRFYDRVLTNKVRSVIAGARFQKRDRRRERSLNGGDPAVHGVYLADQVDLAIDVRDALNTLTAADREVAWLLATDSVAGVARHTDATRGTIRGAKARIARALAAKQLAPDSTDQQPIRAGKRYVCNDGIIHPPSRRDSGLKGKDLAALHPTRGTRNAPPAEEGAPPCPRP
jgi:RNA polymerase sigma-70 factor (ECF subfamily)